MREEVLVILVNWRLADQIEQLLASGALTGQRVLLVDNASQPDEIQALAGRYGAEALLLQENFGFAGAVNRALAASRPARAVLLLNPDVRLRAATVGVLHQRLVRDDLTGVAPLLVRPDGSVQVSGGGPLTARSFLLYFLFLSHLLPKARGVFYTRRQLRAGLAPSWLGMGCLLLRGDAFHRYGPIPEDELVYGEDVAWGVAASHAGARFALATDLRVSHDQGAAGASSRSHPALARLAIRQLGPFRGGLAAGCMWAGLGVRRLVGRTLGPPSTRPLAVPSP